MTTGAWKIIVTWKKMGLAISLQRIFTMFIGYVFIIIHALKGKSKIFLFLYNNKGSANLFSSLCFKRTLLFKFRLDGKIWREIVDDNMFHFFFFFVGQTVIDRNAGTNILQIMKNFFIIIVVHTLQIVWKKRQNLSFFFYIQSRGNENM